MTAQTRRHGAAITSGSVIDLARDAGGLFVAETTAGRMFARTVLLATGVADRHPDVEGLYEAIQRGLIRYCTVCDGYEAMGKRIGVLGCGSSGLREALFMRTYCSEITLLSMDCSLDLSPNKRRRVKAAEIVLVNERVAAVLVEDDRVLLRVARIDDLRFDLLYAEMGSEARSNLVRPLGTKLDELGCVLTDEHQRSSTAGLFAAGDVARGLDQISVAMSEAAIAAITIHNRLRDHEHTPSGR